MRHVNITVRGLVTGVGFRWAAKKQAQSLGISGFVKNMQDGSVYIEAEGDDERLDRFVQWCGKGPLWARVSTIQTQEGMVQGFVEFSIADNLQP